MTLLSLTREEIVKYKSRIIVLRTRKHSGFLSELRESQKHLYNIVEDASEGDKVLVLKRSNLKKRFDCDKNQHGYDFNSRYNLITDFCYNKVNLEDNENKFLVSTGKGHFQFKDFDWRCVEGVDVTWNVKRKIEIKVGRYNNGEYEWNFRELEELMEKQSRLEKWKIPGG